MTPENTTRRDPSNHLLGAMAEGTSDYITGMEADGQRQLVGSTSLPTKTNGTDDAFRKLGFTFGEPDPSDPLFRPATLPDGWRKERTDHSMWSKIVDRHGRERVSIFYKAAFYDRGAFMRLTTVYGYAAELAYNGGEPIFDDWCTRDEFTTALAAVREEKTEYREMYAEKDTGDPVYAAERVRELDQQIAACDRLAAMAAR